jgi:Domain of unknown function (DUF5071)
MRKQYRPDDYSLRQQRRAVRDLLPRDKNDVDAVRRLVAAGYPSVEAVLGDLLKWIRDPEWPVCKPIAELLVQIGAPAVPLLQEFLIRRDGRDFVPALVREVFPHWSSDVLSPLASFVEQQAVHGHWGTDLPALELLIRKRLVTVEYARELLQSKQWFHAKQLSKLDVLANQLSNEDAV